MKQFFEQYGGVALGILALLVLVAMITPVGNIIKTSLQGTTEKFSASIEKQQSNALESNLALITNIGDWNGIRNDGKIYWNNQPVSKFSDYTFNEEGTRGFTSNGREFQIFLDINFNVDGTVHGAAPSHDYSFDIYVDGNLFVENYIDYYGPIDLKTNHKFEIVCKTWPESVHPVETVKTFYIYDVYFSAVHDYDPVKGTMIEHKENLNFTS